MEFNRGPGQSGAPPAYDSYYGYMAFPLGAWNDDGPSHCGAGVQALLENSGEYDIMTGPAGKGDSLYKRVPALTYNSINGEIYVPVLYESSNISE